MPSRRTLLQAASVGLVPIAGCSSPDGSSTTSGPQGLPLAYFSEIVANPDGEDAEHLNEEYVLIEVNTEEIQNLSEFQLEYGAEYQYSFPDSVAEVEFGANLIIRSGNGEDHVERSESPDYVLFAGSDMPLLDNNGMQLTLRGSDGEIVDEVTYSAMNEGSIWARPE